jgi:hypothetical protein
MMADGAAGNLQLTGKCSGTTSDTARLVSIRQIPKFRDGFEFTMSECSISK